MTDTPQVAALKLVTGALSATMAHHNIPETAQFKFTGQWALMGTHTLADALNAANAALEPAADPMPAWRSERMSICAEALGWEWRPAVSNWWRPAHTSDDASPLRPDGASFLVTDTAEQAVRHDLEL